MIKSHKGIVKWSGNAMCKYLVICKHINNKIYLKMLNQQTDYTLSLTISEAIALRILYTDYLQDATTSLGNRLHQISNEVHRLYQ